MLNDNIFFSLYNFAHQSIFVDKMIVFFAEVFPYIVILTAILFLFFHIDNFNLKFPMREFRRRIWEIFLAFFSAGFAWLVAEVLKIIFHSSRPFLAFQNISSLFPETGFAFPSQHATFFMALAFAIFFSHKKIGYVFMFCAFLIGLARIMAGVHFPIDILGGFVLGIGIAYFVRYLVSKK